MKPARTSCKIVLEVWIQLMSFPTALDGGLLVVAYYASDAGGRLIYSNQTETHKQQEVMKIVFSKQRS